MGVADDFEDGPADDAKARSGKGVMASATLRNMLLSWILPFLAAVIFVVGFFWDGFIKQRFGLPEPAFNSAARPTTMEMGALLESVAGLAAFTALVLIALAPLVAYLVGRFDYYNRRALASFREQKLRDEQLTSEFRSQRVEIQSFIRDEHEKIKSLNVAMLAIGDSVLNNETVAKCLAPLADIREDDGSLWMQLAKRQLLDGLKRFQTQAEDIAGGAIECEGEANHEMTLLFRREKKRIRAVSNFDVDGLDFWEKKGDDYLKIHKEVRDRPGGAIPIERVFVFKMDSVTDSDWARWRKVVAANLEVGVTVRVYDEARSGRRDLTRDMLVFGDRTEDYEASDRPVMFRVIKMRDSDSAGVRIVRTPEEVRQAIDDFDELRGASTPISDVTQFDTLRAPR